MKKLSSLFSFVFALSCLFTPSYDLEGCTGIKLVAADNSLVHGRTLEFGETIDTSVVIVPRGYEFTGTTNNGPGLKYISKYAVVGAIAFDQIAVMDGMNEKGLAAGIFYFPDFAQYTPLTADNQSKALSPIEFTNWILTQFETIEEVKKALNSVVIVPTTSAAWGNMVPPFHYIVYDKAGNALVIEPTGGKLVTFDNPIGVLTNSPNFDWHATNIRNYINLTPFNVKPYEVHGITLAPLGQGSGMVGLPGDFTPPSRFVRAVIFSATAVPSKNADEAIYQGFHILNNFDIPVGISREKSGNVTHTDYTMITCMRDPQSLKYYFRTYDDQTIRFIDMKKFDLDGKDIKKAPSTGKEVAIDISGDLK